MPSVTGSITGKIFIQRNATTPSIINRPRFVSGTNSDWGILKWDEIVEGDNYVRVDILKDSDNTLLAEDLKWKVDGIDLITYPNVASNNIKLRFKLFILDKTPIIRNVQLRHKSDW